MAEHLTRAKPETLRDDPPPPACEGPQGQLELPEACVLVEEERKGERDGGKERREEQREEEPSCSRVCAQHTGDTDPAMMRPQGSWVPPWLAVPQGQMNQWQAHCPAGFLKQQMSRDPEPRHWQVPVPRDTW